MDSTTEKKLNYLSETKDLIREAIAAQGVEISTSDTFRSYAEKIEEIEGSGGEEEQPTAVDLSGYDEGVIVETFEDGTTRTSNLEFDSAGNVSKVTADGVETSYSYEFDSEGNVTKISDSNGNATEIIGGDISIGTNIDLVKTTTVLDFSSGDMEVTPNDGEAFAKVSIPKPSTLVAENIVDGVTIAGIEGTHADRELEDKSITLDFSSGDMAVTADDGKAFGSVSIPQPETLLAENIAEGIDIAGIIGTLSGTELEDTTVTLDFSGGAMEVTPETGSAFSKVTIPQPETLLPENIAEGIDIAGIIGTLAGKSFRLTQGTISGGTQSITIEHNLGVIPDIFVLIGSGTVATGTMIYAMAFSSAFIEAAGLTTKGYVSKFVSTTGFVRHATNAIDETSNALNSATETTIVAGSSSYQALAYYQWYAIGGLT